MASAQEQHHLRCQRWAQETGEAYCCPGHGEPDPFCGCADATGRLFILAEGERTEVLDGKRQERAAAIQEARRRYHQWADGQRPNNVAARDRWRGMIRERKAAVAAHKAWRRTWEAAGFRAVGIYERRVGK